MITHKPYPSDVSDAEWQFVVPYLCLLPEDASQRVHNLRDVFDALRSLVRSGAPWRYLPAVFPPWEMVYQQTRRWLAAGCFEVIVHHLRAVIRFADGRNPEPTAAIFDGRTMQSTPESGGRAGYDGYKRKKGSKVHMAVDTLGHLLALHVTPANEQERAQVDTLAKAVQEVTVESVELAYVDQGYTGEDAFDAAANHGVILEVVKLEEAKRGFVLLPRRWVVERSFGWAARFRRLAKDNERLSETLAGLHFVAFALLMLKKAAPLFEWSSYHARSRLKDSGWATVLNSNTVGRDGKVRPQSCIDLAELSLWLANINAHDPRYVDFRKKLLRNQKEACVVLKAHFVRVPVRLDDCSAVISRRAPPRGLVEVQRARLATLAEQGKMLTEAVQHLVHRTASYASEIKEVLRTSREDSRFVGLSPRWASGCSAARHVKAPARTDPPHRPASDSGGPAD
jgi:transposase